MEEEIVAQIVSIQRETPCDEALRVKRPGSVDVTRSDPSSLHTVPPLEAVTTGVARRSDQAGIREAKKTGLLGARQVCAGNRPTFGSRLPQSWEHHPVSKEIYRRPRHSFWKSSAQTEK